MSDSMAQKMKRKLSAKSVTAIVLFGAIILVFVFFGLPGQMGAGVGSAAQVNNTFISFADYQQEEKRISQQYQQMFNMDIGPQRQFIRQQALEGLIRMELISQAAAKNGILATDAEVRDFITKDIPAFQQDGFFQREFYMGYLNSVRMSPVVFEDKVRKDILNIRTRSLFEGAAKPFSAELSKNREASSFKVNVAFVKFDTSKVKDLPQEQADEIVKSIETALKEGNEAALAPLLKKVNAQWEETGFADITAELNPKLGSQIATEAVLELSKNTPLLSRLVRDGSQKFILKYKASKVEEPATSKADLEMAEKRRGDSLFNSWVSQFRDRSNVKINQQVLSM